MKQVVQSARSGRLSLREVPEPRVRAGHVLVRTRASVISAGTERMVVEFAKKSLVGKAQARPDLVRKVIDKARRDGIAATVRAVLARLDEPLPLGYSAAGEVIAVGSGLEGTFAAGQRVAIAGAGVANHAELNVVPRALAVSVPEGVPDEQACFATLGAIALHAVRNASVGLGDTVAVIGVGLIGQIATQLLALSGARALALDYDAGRLDLARRLGAEIAWDLALPGLGEAVTAFSGGRGVDAVIVAAATESEEPLATAAAIARDRARVVLVGKTGTAFPYGEFMKKELNLVASRAYGPGRYDSDFETRGIKYPEGWVRWTETENMAEVLRVMTPDAAGRRGARLDVASLISHRFSFAEAERAYALVSGGEPSLGVVLAYPPTANVVRPAFAAAKAPAKGRCVVGAIGAGAFARSVLFPELKKIAAVDLDTVVARRGATAGDASERFGFRAAAADERAALDSPAINAVVIATRHDSHAALACEALKTGKAVLVEKPLALTFEELNRVIDARAAVPEGSGAFLQVGFNRRFAPLARELKDRLAKAPGPKFILIRVNAGALASDSWAASAEEGGGRIAGEACHFVDLARYLIGAAVASVAAEAATPVDAQKGGLAEDASLQMRFADGSLATVAYTARGDAGAGKERIEAFAGGAAYVLDDFRTLAVTEGGKTRTLASRSAPDKGIAAELAAFVAAVASGGPAPVDEAETIETSAAILAAMESLRTGQRVTL